MAGLKVERLSKTFGKHLVLKDIQLHVQLGEIVVLLGPSGCGKSTLLNLISGLDTPDQGEISWNGTSLDSVPPHQRGFGLMFQDHALFPHRNVHDNVAFGLEMAHWSKPKMEQRISEVLGLVGLPDFADRDVNTLSGGESQRVALARSLAPFPHLLMLDEPLGLLDRNLRERLVADLRKILKSSNQTAIYVTHDHEEAYLIADQVIVMSYGSIEQVGTPQQIYHHPASVFVAKFLGLNNLVLGTAKQDLARTILETPIGSFPSGENIEGQATVLIRPDRMQLTSLGDHQLQGIVKQISFRGPTCQVFIQINQIQLEFHFPSSTQLPSIGEQIYLKFDLEDAVQIFTDQTKYVNPSPVI